MPFPSFLLPLPSERSPPALVIRLDSIWRCLFNARLPFSRWRWCLLDSVLQRSSRFLPVKSTSCYVLQRCVSNVFILILLVAGCLSEHICPWRRQKPGCSSFQVLGRSPPANAVEVFSSAPVFCLHVQMPRFWEVSNQFTEVLHVRMRGPQLVPQLHQDLSGPSPAMWWCTPSNLRTRCPSWLVPATLSSRKYHHFEEHGTGTEVILRIVVRTARTQQKSAYGASP